jgi:hypothetical protein
MWLTAPATVEKHMNSLRNTVGRPPLPAAAQRALAEAQLRRAAQDRQVAEKRPELSGRDGPDPTRYGDWEVNGLASDF